MIHVVSKSYMVDPLGFILLQVCSEINIIPFLIYVLLFWHPVLVRFHALHFWDIRFRLGVFPPYIMVCVLVWRGDDMSPQHGDKFATTWRRKRPKTLSLKSWSYSKNVREGAFPNPSLISSRRNHPNPKLPPPLSPSHVLRLLCVCVFFFFLLLEE